MAWLPRKSGLRAVVPGEKPPAPVKPLTVADSAAAGERRELLVAMRNRIARAIDDPVTQPTALAALTKRLMEIVQQIEAFDAAVEAEKESGSGAASVADTSWEAI